MHEVSLDLNFLCISSGRFANKLFCAKVPSNFMFFRQSEKSNKYFLHHGEYVNINFTSNILACLWLWLQMQEVAK